MCAAFIVIASSDLKFVDPKVQVKETTKKNLKLKIGLVFDNEFLIKRALFVVCRIITNVLREQKKSYLRFYINKLQVFSFFRLLMMEFYFKISQKYSSKTSLKILKLKWSLKVSPIDNFIDSPLIFTHPLLIRFKSSEEYSESPYHPL